MSVDIGPESIDSHEKAKVILIVEDDEGIGRFLVQAILQETSLLPLRSCLPRHENVDDFVYYP